MAGHAGEATAPEWIDDAALERCRALDEPLGDGRYRLDASGRFAAVDDGFAALTGRDREAVLGRHVSSLLAETDAAAVESTVETMRSDDLAAATLEVGLEGPDGETVPCRMRLTPLRSDGEFRGTVGVVRAVDEEDGGDDASTDTGEEPRSVGGPDRRYRALAEHLPNGVVTMFDRDLRYTLAAGRGFEDIEPAPSDLEGRRVEEVWDGETLATLLPVFLDVLDGAERSLELGYGGREWLVRCVPVTDDAGEVVAGLAMTQDVTDRTRLRERLRRHNRTLQRLYEISADGERPFEERVEAVLELGRSYLDLEVGFLAAVDRTDGGFEVRHAAGDDERFEPGATAPLSETYCRRTVDRDGLLCVNDAPSQGWTGDPAHDRWDLDAYVGGTLTVDGEPFGTLCFVSDGPREAPFTDAEKRFVELATQWVSHELERRRRERDLREYREYTDEVLDAVDDVFYTLDAAGDVRRWNESLEAATGYDGAELAGTNTLEFFDEEHRETFVAALHEVVRTGSTRVEAPIRTSDGEAVPYEFVASRLEAPDGSTRVTGVGRDISERRAHEAELQRRQRQQRVVAALGQLALETDDLEELAAEATARLAETLDTDYAGLLELDDEAGELALRQVVGADPDLVGHRVDADDGSQSGYTLGTDEPVVVEDLEAETRFEASKLLIGGDVTSGLSTVVGSADDPWGVLTAHDTDRRTFAEEDVDFLQSVANVLATAIDRRDHERRLEQQRERLAALNSLHEVIHGITDAVIERSTREEIERAVCEHLAASDSYRFAWIGDVDTAAQEVIPRASAGTDGYLEDVEISIDPDDPRSDGPGGQAYLTGEVQTCQHVRTDPRFEPWREQAEAHGFRSSASIPIVHEDTVFGVLNVYAERPYAFADEEREIIEQVGEVVGHAIAAVERKRALMTDELLEVEFRVRDLFDAADAPDAGGRIAFDRAVPVDGDEHVLYGRVDAEGRETLESVIERQPCWRSVQFRGDDDEQRFEVRAAEAPLVEAVADHGGVVETAVVEDGDLNVTVHVPQGADVRGLIDDVESRHPGVELLARRGVKRSPDHARESTLALTEELTDRQLTALETAYHAGFFAWPRDSSGEELAERLGISPATLSQHLRTAERKVLDALFEELPASR